MEGAVTSFMMSAWSVEMEPEVEEWLGSLGAKQFASLAAKLIEIGAVGKPGHSVSWLPGFAFGRDEKTILPKV